ncbi:junctional protein associated with coronary artery disease [Callorhinchus milii]|uniref:junctional protein associated with coronary artery disease n=1 Tax=Callorhinchus milii TaxID=7868 RepID=UPI001C3F857F|nr:junctional protein associated with coronary artery disease [Callorhinchus milii]XP_007903632.2 junctional protein associated with coronary artery disease [Callorhinchus milii]XP_007903633.2 junctional protein associated with coronary artery disease [Callorhinchus milii]XP_042188060.1 junctional protein associated with coronary artery disease [Callorhinchus milii]
MFSVEDLLISHGYQPPKKTSKDKPPSSNENTFAGYQREARENRSTHGTVNGYETDTGAYLASRQAQVKGYFSDNECREGNAWRQADVSHCADVHNVPTTFAVKEAGLNGGPPLLCPSGPKSEKDITYWRRRGQDFSVLLDYTNRGDSDYRGYNATKTQNIPNTEQGAMHLQHAALKEKQRTAETSRINEQKHWFVEGQSMMAKEMYEDKWRLPEDRMCQSLGTEEWRSSLGRQLSDGNGHRFGHGLFSQVVGNEACKTERGQNIRKEKSQSLPRVVPESSGNEFQTSLHYIDMSGLDGDRLENQRLQGYKLQDSSSYFNSKASSNFTESFGQSAQFALLSKPKFSRPLKPPSYELYQQIRRSSEMIPSLQVRGENDEQVTYFAKDEAIAGSNSYSQAAATTTSLEPPGYVPPPSYKAPPQQKVSQKCSDKVPSCNNMCQPYRSAETPSDKAHWSLEHQERDCAQQKQILINTGSKEQLLQAKSTPQEREIHNSSHNGYMDDQKAFVKYIPFDDPRIRHITIVQSEKQYGEANTKHEQRNAWDRAPNGNKTFEPSDHCSAFSVPLGSVYSTQAGLRPIVDCTSGNRWLVASKPENQNGTKSDHCCKPYVRNQCDSSLKSNSTVCSNTNQPAAFPQPSTNTRQEAHTNQGTFETITQVKKWEPDSQCFEIQEKKRPKRRMTETIFCLVSVPVKTQEDCSNGGTVNVEVSDANAEKDTDESAGNLTEQSLLSMSSSDLELQALMGNMTAENGLKRPEIWKDVSNRHRAGYNFNQHNVLRATGSWPGDQYRDQETQTSFNKAPRSAKQITGIMKKLATGSQTQSQNCSEPAVVKDNQRSEEVTTINDQKYKQSVFSINGQTSLYPSTNSAFSRTTSAQNQVSNVNAHQSYLEVSSKNLREKDVSIEDLVEYNVRGIQATSNNSREAVGFGQFLLKPVNRRPWDAISELESFNKEIQEVEDHNRQFKAKEDGDQTETQPANPDADGSNGQTVKCQKPTLPVPEKSSAKISKAKEELESRESQMCHNDMYITSESQTFSKVGAVDRKQGSQSGHLFWDLLNTRTLDSEGSTGIKASTAKGVQFTEVNHEQNVDGISDKRQNKSINGVRKRMYYLSETAAESNRSKDISTNAMAPSKQSVPNDTECDDTIGLTLVHKDPDYFETELNSRKCQKSTKPNVDNLNDLFEQKTAELAKNESLEERASRILGIEVAVESLISSGKKIRNQDAEENETKCFAEQEVICSGHFPSGKMYSSVEPLWCATTDLSDVNKLPEWKQSPFNGTAPWVPGEHKALGNKLPKRPREKNEDSQWEKRAIINELFHGPFTEFYSWADKHCCFSTEGETVPAPGADRKSRNTSEMIGALQGKLSVSPHRAALDRLARMKEVDSVSRIRRLSIKSTDSGDELEEEQYSAEQGEKESGVYVSARKEGTCTTSLSVSLTIKTTSLDHDLKPFVSSRTTDAESRENGDAYDPSKVETV